MADGILQRICHKIHVCSVHHKTKMQLEQIRFTCKQVDPVLSAGLWEWERVGKTTQPKHGVVISWLLFPSFLPNGFIHSLHYFLNRNSVNSGLRRKIPLLRRNVRSLQTIHRLRSQKKKNGHEERTNSSTTRHFQSNCGIYFSLNTFSGLMGRRCTGQEPPGITSSTIIVSSCTFFKSPSVYSLHLFCFNLKILPLLAEGILTTEINTGIAAQPSDLSVGQ